MRLSYAAAAVAGVAVHEGKPFGEPVTHRNSPDDDHAVRSGHCKNRGASPSPRLRNSTRLRYSTQCSSGSKNGKNAKPSAASSTETALASGQIETLNFHAAVDVPAPGEQRRVSDLARVEATVAKFGAGLRDSLQSRSRIRGWISNQLFGLVAADLGGCKLVKQEDTGGLFYEDEVKLPDWRLTLLSGKNILVEIKAENDNHPRVSKLRMAEVARLKNYAELNGCPLYIAVLWVAMSRWTLVPVDDYVRVGDHFEIDLETAFRRNHIDSLLNDHTLGLRPPLKFRMETQEVPGEDGATTVELEPEEEGTGKLSLLIAQARLFAGGKEMVDKNETTKLSINVKSCLLPRLVPTDLRSDRLPLWHFILHPPPPTAVEDK